jgi:hypothetical protein
MPGAAAATVAAVAFGISVRLAAPRTALTWRRAQSVVRAAVSVKRGEKAYTVKKSEEIFNAAKVSSRSLLPIAAASNGGAEGEHCAVAARPTKWPARKGVKHLLSRGRYDREGCS